VLGQDLRDFFFGCNIVFAETDSISSHRTPVTSVSFEAKLGTEPVKVRAKIFKSNKLKCARCTLYQPAVTDGICSDCRRVMDAVAAIEAKEPERKMLE